MTLYRTSVAAFSEGEKRLADILTENMITEMHHRPSESETRSWTRSLSALRTDLADAGLAGVEMLIEYQLPLTSKRADVVLAGTHPATGKTSYMVVELKQWTNAELFDDDKNLVRISQYGHRPVTHPVLQVRDYCDYLISFTTVLAENPQAVSGVAYLHNATDRDVSDLYQLPGDDHGRLYTGQHRSEFQEFLKSKFAANDSGAQAADELLASRIAPSRQLLAVAAEEVQRREMFILLDEQRDAYLYVLHAVERARRSTAKTAVVISGGPGSGKSVIALSLLGELSRQGRTVLHATGSRSFTQTLRKEAGKRAPRVKKMFQYFNSFIAAEPNDIEVLILDEAHRIRETSASRWTSAKLRTGRPQIDELLDAARVPVFLLDEYQVVRPGELGTATDIRTHAATKEIATVEIRLDAQFRCGGSKVYVDWAKRLLGLEPGGPEVWLGDGRFDVTVAESPWEMEQFLQSKIDAGFSARMAAGYCWPWSDPRDDGTLVPDVVIDNWSRPWNLKGDRSVGGAPSAALWATDPVGFGQVGCIYTAQGFEYDYAGVIFGPDFVCPSGTWQSMRGANKDPDFKNTAKVPDADFDRLIRNVYKVLLTRGMRGVMLYSTDGATRQHLADLIR